MKKTIKSVLTALICVLSIAPAMTQNIYVKVNGGYAFPAGMHTLFNTTSNAITSVDLTEAKKYSFGKGVDFGGTFGNMFNKNIGLEISINYLIGSKTEFTSDVTTVPVNSTTLNEIKSKMLYFIPAILIDAGFEKISPYAKLGVVIGIPRVIMETNSTYTPLIGSIDKIYQKKETKMDVGIGSSAVLGITYNISEKLSIYGEGSFINLSVNPKSSLVTEYTVNGTDELASLHVIQKETVYEESVVDDFYNPIPDSDPNVIIKTKEPFSSIGINIGVKICL